MKRATVEPELGERHGEIRRQVLLHFGEFRWLFLVAAGGALAALLDAPTAVRLLLGLPLALFIPGYALVCALFPRREGLDGLERFGLSFALSLAILPLLALAIDRSPWELGLRSILLALLGVTALGSTLATVRRSRVPRDEQFRPVPPAWAPQRGEWSGTTRLAVVVLVGSLVLFVGSAAVIVAGRLQGDPMTEFALYSPEGKAEFYPRTVTVGEPVTVIIEITNRERSDERYRLRITADGREVSGIEDIAVARGATWRQPVVFTVPAPGERIPVTFELYRTSQGDEAEPYRTLRLYVTAHGG